MDRWKIKTPNEVITGAGSYKGLINILKEQKIKNVFAIIDINVKKTKFGKDLIKSLQPFKATVFSDFSTNPTFNDVANGLLLIKNSKPDCILALGGGSSIDLAKAIGLVASNGSKLNDYFAGKTINKKLPYFVAIPTTCGTGSESSPYAVIMDSAIPKKRGIESSHLLPSLVILDPNSLISLDKSMIAASGLDALAHILESHISKKSTSLIKITTKGLLYSLKNNLEKAIFEKDKTALFNLQIIAFTARLLYPRTGLTIAHALSHPLGAHTNIHHGMVVSILLKQSLIFNKSYCKVEQKEAMVTMGFKNDAQFFNWLDNILNKSKINQIIIKQLSDMNLPIKNIAEEALESSNVASNPRPLTKNQVIKIITKSLKSLNVNQ